MQAVLSGASERFGKVPPQIGEYAADTSELLLSGFMKVLDVGEPVDLVDRVWRIEAVFSPSPRL